MLDVDRFLHYTMRFKNKNPGRTPIRKNYTLLFSEMNDSILKYG